MQLQFAQRRQVLRDPCCVAGMSHMVHATAAAPSVPCHNAAAGPHLTETAAGVVVVDKDRLLHAQLWAGHRVPTQSWRTAGHGTHQHNSARTRISSWGESEAAQTHHSHAEAPAEGVGDAIDQFQRRWYRSETGRRHCHGFVEC